MEHIRTLFLSCCKKAPKNEDILRNRCSYLLCLEHTTQEKGTNFLEKYFMLLLSRQFKGTKNSINTIF